MATKKDATPDSPLAMTLAPETAIAVVDERPAFLTVGDTRGTETLGKDDMQMPRIALAQQMSPELVEDNPKFIDGLKQGMMFNSVTREIIGKGPIMVTVIRRDPPRYVEFVPRDAGGGVKDPNVPANDPRTQFGPDGELPLATKFYDYILMRVDRPGFELIAASFKSTGLKVARNWNALIKLRNAPVFAGAYQLGVVKEKNAKGEFFNFSIKNAGWLTEEMAKHAEGAYEALKDRVVEIHREGDEGGGDTTFDTTSM